MSPRLFHGLIFNKLCYNENFNNLKELGLIKEIKEEKRYELYDLDKSIAMLIPFKTLRQLNNSLNHNSISIYVYLNISSQSGISNLRFIR